MRDHHALLPLTDHPQSVALASRQPRQNNRCADKIIAAQTKSALHRTRLQVLHHKNFQFDFFYKRYGQPARLLAFCPSSPTEKSEKNFSDFQF
ncbi:hypothetical protein [Pantoea sp. JV6]|uniref:hypothetical protein n=1 Tax=Pantoea sp. JV6 TaxID=2981604 RepID=UPI00221EF459|nr:hypothetical protein [Pantoea sp. JV6]MCW0976688.1 hypothetical protein [Pantoea sp. JV6]